MAKYAGPKLSPIVKSLGPMLNSIYDSQRVTTTAFFGEVSWPEGAGQGWGGLVRLKVHARELLYRSLNLLGSSLILSD